MDDAAPLIAISALTLVPGELGGSETYLRELMLALGRVGRLRYRAVLPPVAPAGDHGLPAVVAHRYRAARSVPERLVAMGLASVAPRRLRHELAGASLVHFPLTIELPRTPLRKVVTLHDVQHLDLPRMFPRAERAFRSALWHPSVRRASSVIVMSDFVRRRAIATLALDPARVHVVPLGLDRATLVPGPEPERREPFLLYPARRWPHKNHDRLFEAFERVRLVHPRIRLVLTGGGRYDSLPEGVEALGRVDTRALVSLFQRAAAVVFPSLYEGFGLPPLEAMACGCPVACSTSGALPETVGDAARLFDPLDVTSIADATLEVLADPAPWVERGLARAGLFSWDETARRTEAVYASLLA